MSAGTMLLTIAAILVFCGLMQRILDRMYLTDRQALVLIGAMLAGTFLPDQRLGVLSVNIGGGLIPLGVCIYLLLRSNETAERIRALFGSILTGGAVFLVSYLMPSEAEEMLADPIWLYGVAGGVIAWVLGRSRRCAFICGVAGVILADIASWAIATAQGYQTKMTIGGAGIADAVVISGVIAVLLCELAGEMVERLVRIRARRGGGL